MRKNKKRYYNLEFKQQAAVLARDIGPKKAAEQLGVSVATIQNWKNDNLSGSDSEKNPRKSKASVEAENKRLQKENEELKKVNHILKRAAAFFSQDHLK